jgi:glycine cleavage system H protein
MIDGFEFRTDRAYDPVEGLWVSDCRAGVHRVGVHALAADSYGALAQLVLDAAGTAITRGGSFGSLEAAKFVGPLLSPLTGTVRAVNAAVLADPGLVLASPYDDGWLVEIEITGADPGLDLLVHGDPARAWFARTVSEHREKGLGAE